MYYQEDQEQLAIEEFFQSFAGRLRKDNRWARLAAIMPWEYIEKMCIQNLSEESGLSQQPSAALHRTSNPGIYPLCQL